MTSLAGTRLLIGLVVRRDRLRLALWIGGLVALMAVSAAQVRSLYGNPAAIANYVSTVGDNPALVAFAGPGYGFDHPNLGVVLVNETSLWMALGCALMSIFLVNRHTRAEEDDNRADLLRSAVVGRHAPTAAALSVAGMANVLVGIGAAVACIAMGYAVTGSIALAVSIAGVGLVFAAVTAAMAQIGSTGRATLGLASAAVGLAFVARGITDVSAPDLSWLSPFGWGIGVRAFAHERWWPLAGLGVFAFIVSAAAFALSVRRDLGSGILAQRAGRSVAHEWTTHPLGLVLRLQRGAILGWSIGLFLTGVVYGSLGNDIEQMLTDNPQLAEYVAALGGASVTDSYLATSLGMMAMLAAGFALSSALRIRSEEAAGYGESMLATPLSRSWWAGSHLVVTFAGTLVVVFAGGLGAGIGYGAVTGNGSQVWRLSAAALVRAPALLVLVGAAIVLFGWLPRLVPAVWAMLAAVVVIGVLGNMLRIPHWIRQLSPLEHVPARPAEHWETLSPVLLLGLFVALTAVGLVGFRRRDLSGA